MTEITEMNITKRSHLIDPVAFFVALIAAPFVVTGATFWIFFVPVAAIVMGGPVYLVVAAPVLLWWLGRHEPDTGEIALLGFVANLVLCGLWWLFTLLAPSPDQGMSVLYLVFGSIFAPVWAGVFAVLYRSMRRPFFTQTI